MRIALFKVREESSISEVLEARGVVGHAVAVSWEVRGKVAVAVIPLVQAGIATQVGGGSVGCDSPLSKPRHGGSIVREVFYGGVPDVVSGGHEVQLAEDAGLFQVTVGDHASRVLPSDQFRLHLSRERLSPDVASPAVVEVHTAHAWQRSVGSP